MDSALPPRDMKPSRLGRFPHRGGFVLGRELSPAASPPHYIAIGIREQQILSR